MPTQLPVIVPLNNRIARLALIHAGETTLKFRLGAAPRTIDDLTVLADVTPEEATFTGYTSGGLAITYTTGYITPDLIPSNESQLLSSIVGSPATVGNTIYYWWIDNGTDIIMAGNFPTPIAMSSPGNALKVMIEDSYPPTVDSVQVIP